jgi:hypothetical protein
MAVSPGGIVLFLALTGFWFWCVYLAIRGGIRARIEEAWKRRVPGDKRSTD